ncbi:MAG: ectoine/hydroxyectoine ABC transporter permease subunit EhuD [Candidatus Nitrospinota bacterium M3_3B_026]
MIFDWKYTAEILPELLRALVVTVEATALGMGIALVLGLLWALLRMSGSSAVSGTASWAVEFIRDTPLLIQIYFFFYVAPEFGPKLSPFATGVIALGVHYSAYLAEVYRAGIEAVGRGQWEAAVAMNFSRADTWRRIILPQAIPPMIPVLGNYLIAMFKDTPMLAAITVMELLQTAKLMGAESFRYLEPLTVVGLLFLLVSLASSVAVRKLEERFA